MVVLPLFPIFRQFFEAGGVSPKFAQENPNLAPARPDTDEAPKKQRKQRKQFELGQRPRADLHAERIEAGCDRHYPLTRMASSTRNPSPLSRRKATS